MSILPNSHNSASAKTSVANNSQETTGIFSGEDFLNAAVIGNNQIISDYLLQGGNINIYDNSRNTALHNAVHNRLPSVIVSLLVHNGADGQLNNNDGKTPLQIAEESFEKLSSELKTATRYQRALLIPQEKLDKMTKDLNDFEIVKTILEFQKTATKEPKPISGTQLKTPTLERIE